MTLAGALRGGVLIAAYVLGTITFGWWSVPAIAALWGLIAGRGRAWTSAIAAVVAWAALLAFTAARGAPLASFAHQLAGAMAVPAWTVLSAEFALPLTLAWSATAVFGSIRERSP
jgi:hypothetical protein